MLKNDREYISLQTNKTIMTKLFLILILIGIVLIAGCTSETQPNTVMPPEQSRQTALAVKVQNSMCRDLATCGYLKSNTNTPPIMTGDCIYITHLVQRNAPQIKKCLEDSYGATWETDIAKLRCTYGLASRASCDKQGAPYSSPAK